MAIRRRIIRKSGAAAPTPASEKPLIVARPRVRLPKANPPIDDTSAPGDPISSPEPAKPKRKHHKTDRTGPNWTEDGDYIVGKGRTPVDTRWKPNQSGNPAGPKKKEKLTPEQAFDEQVLGEFTTRVNGVEVPMNNGTFSLNLLKQAAAKGNVRAQLAVLQIYRERLSQKISPEVAAQLSAEDEQAIEEFLQSLQLPSRPVVRKPRIDPDQSDDSDDNGEDVA